MMPAPAEPRALGRETWSYAGGGALIGFTAGVLISLVMVACAEAVRSASERVVLGTARRSLMPPCTGSDAVGTSARPSAVTFTSLAYTKTVRSRDASVSSQMPSLGTCAHPDISKRKVCVGDAAGEAGLSSQLLAHAAHQNRASHAVTRALFPITCCDLATARHRSRRPPTSQARSTMALTPRGKKRLCVETHQIDTMHIRQLAVKPYLTLGT